MHSVLPYVTVGAGTLPGILTFRLLPFVGYVGLSGRRPWLARGFVVAFYVPLALLAARHGGTPFYWLVLAYLYYGGAGWLAYEFARYVHSNAGWFVAVVLLFWAIPAIAVHPIPQTFLLLGWDFTLAAYSFGVDTRTGPTPPLRDFLFFLLVNPALVYRNRGCQVAAPSVDVGGLVRAALGVFAVFLSVGTIQVAHAYLISRSPTVPRGGAAGAAVALAIGALRFCRDYAAQSGVASLQIGCMRQLGYRLPERYRYPLLSRSPAEFWRRWNTYVGGWAQAYVFTPLAATLRLRSKRGRSATRRVYAIAVVLTFAVVGFFHDAFIMAVERSWSLSATVWFVCVACLVVAWETVFANVARKPRPGADLARRSLFLIAGCWAAAHWR